jgi:hypothetical protein
MFVYLWHDVLLQKHFLCFCCRTGHREKHRRLEPILKICFFATTQMHVNSVSSPERMIATWQAMHKVIWSTISYILWINCCISLWTQFVCVSRERERASLRKIFLIVDYILPGCKGLFFIMTNFENLFLYNNTNACQFCFLSRKNDCCLTSHAQGYMIHYQLHSQLLP